MVVSVTSNPSPRLRVNLLDPSGGYRASTVIGARVILDGRYYKGVIVSQYHREEMFDIVFIYLRMGSRSIKQAINSRETNIMASRNHTNGDKKL